MNYKNVLKELLIYCWDNKKIEEFEFIFKKYFPEDFIEIIKCKNYQYEHPDKCLDKLQLDIQLFKEVKINISSEVKRRNKRLKDERILTQLLTKPPRTSKLYELLTPKEKEICKKDYEKLVKQLEKVGVFFPT